MRVTRSRFDENESDEDGAGEQRASEQGAGEQGAVTAETALVLPLLVAVTLTMTWLVLVGITQVRVVDAAREAARVMARGEGPDEAATLVRQVAPGATLRIERTGGRVVVTVRDRIAPPAGLLGDLPGAVAEAEAVAAVEQR